MPVDERSLLSVVVAGASGPLGRRVCQRLVDHPQVGKVAGFDLRADPAVVGLEFVSGDVEELDLEGLLAGADVVVHLISGLVPWPDETSASLKDVGATRRLLQAAGEVGVGRVVLLSTSMVYGAWPNNSVPLTEASPLRPVPEFDFAINKAELERFATQWREDHPSVTMVTLRPTTNLAEDHVGWVTRSLGAAAQLIGENEIPVQFLHLDDLASAVELSVVGSLEGTYNVAPEGWISSGTILDLMGRTPRVQIPDIAIGHLSAWWWKHRLAPTSPGVIQYVRHPWVVASDRLRSAGWTPQHTSEQAFVTGYQGRPWAMLDSRRRQQLALSGAIAGGVGLAWGTAVAVRRVYRGRSRPRL